MKTKYFSDYFLWLTIEMRALMSLLCNSLIFRPIKKAGTPGKDVSYQPFNLALKPQKLLVTS